METTTSTASNSPAPAPSRVASGRRGAVWALAGALMVAPWVERGRDHPWMAGWTRLLEPATRPATLPDATIHAALDEVVDDLDPDEPLALRWQTPDVGALAFLWVTAAYRMAPRPVFPLLEAAEIDALRASGQLDPQMAAELLRRSEAIRQGDGVAVVWGTETPCALPVPGLVPVERQGPVCELRAAEATP